jgi:hypothetical protein
LRFFRPLLFATRLANPACAASAELLNEVDQRFPAATIADNKLTNGR